MYNLHEDNSRMADELSELRHRGEEQRAALEKKSAELETRVMKLTSDLSKVDSDLRDSAANYELRIETLESKLRSSNDCLQVTRYIWTGAGSPSSGLQLALGLRTCVVLGVPCEWGFGPKWGWVSRVADPGNGAPQPRYVGLSTVTRQLIISRSLVLNLR